MLLTEPCAQRLLTAGLVFRMAASEVSDESLQLTEEGLALMRSSDQ